MIGKIDWKKVDGLLPVVIQDENTHEVLMLGYMNEEALKKTLQEKKVTFYSRTKNRLWTKGETSGNFLMLSSIDFSCSLDCDNDTLLIKVRPMGPTCHLGHRSCFNMEGHFNLKSLENIISERVNENSDSSYTSKLFYGPEDRLIQKVGEESVETVIAAKNNDGQELLNEMADLFYHSIVLLKRKSLSLKDLEEILEKRHLEV